jgi:DnaK suppressor protein
MDRSLLGRCLAEGENRTVALAPHRAHDPIERGAVTLSCMDQERARRLLARERERIEQAIAGVGEADARAAADQSEPGDRGSEDLYQHEFDAGLAEDLAAQLAALERAETRLAAGIYGLSIESGEPIPDERLEALPTAERTVEEQELRDRS